MPFHPVRNFIGTKFLQPRHTDKHRRVGELLFANQLRGSDDDHIGDQNRVHSRVWPETSPVTDRQIDATRLQLHHFRGRV